MYMKNKDLEFKSYSYPKSNAFKTYEEFENACKDLMTRHIEFTNQMLKRLNFLQDDFYRLIYEDFKDSSFLK